jgi:hypothetical protein
MSRREFGKARSERNIHHYERRWLLWNHGSWSKIDRLFVRRERRAAKRDWRREWGV